MAKQDEEAHSQDWRGFSCPECHTLFRVPAASAGKRVECPQCGKVSLIPERGPGAGSEASSPAASTAGGIRPAGEMTSAPRKAREDGAKDPGPLRFTAPARPDADGPRVAGRRVRRKVNRAEQDDLPPPDWETESGVRQGGSQAGLLWGAVGLIALMTGVSVVILSGSGSESAPPADDSSAPKPEREIEPAVDSGEPKSIVGEVANLEMGATLERIEEVVAKFLAAESVEEMARWVRGGEATAERMRTYHRDRPVDPVAFNDIAPRGKVQKSGPLWSVDVVLEKFEVRPIAVEATPSGYLVDWESWVGYSEMRWEDFIEKRPTTPVLFRVLCSDVPYYNFDFRDEREWKSYRLVSPDQQHTLYGYVPRYSAMGRMLAPSGDAGDDRPQAFMLKLRFAETSSGGNQVVIDEVVGAGWVEPEEN